MSFDLRAGSAAPPEPLEQPFFTQIWVFCGESIFFSS